VSAAYGVALFLGTLEQSACAAGTEPTKATSSAKIAFLILKLLEILTK
jgi:hypothetical protein